MDIKELKKKNDKIVRTYGRNVKRMQAHTIRKQLRYVLDVKGITQSELARLMGAKRQRIHQILHDGAVLHPETVSRIEKALKIKFSKF